MALDKRATRLGVLALVGTLLFGLVGARLWFLQTVEQAGLQEEVEQTKRRTVPLLPERGRIFDADGRILADNERVLTVAVDWDVIRRDSDRAEIFRRLSGWIDVPIEEMEARFDSQVYSPFLPMPVAEDIDEPTAAAILERVEDLPGVADPRGVASGLSVCAVGQPRRGLHGSHHRRDQGRVPRAGVPAQRTGREVRHRAVDAGGAARHGRLRDLRGRQVEPHRARDRAGPGRQRPGHPAHHRSRPAAVRRTGARDAAQAAPVPVREERARPRDQLHDALLHRLPRAGAVQGAGRCGRGAEPRERPHRRVGQLPDVRQPVVRSRPRRRTFRRAVPVQEPRRHPDRSRRVDPRQPCDPGALQPRVDVQTVHGLRRAQHRAVQHGRLLRRHAGPIGWTRSSENRCNSGLVRCVFKNATCSGTGRPCVYGAVDVETAARRVERRVLLPHRRADHGRERLRAGAAGAGPRSSGSVPTPGSICRSSSTAPCPTRSSRRGTQNSA